MKLNKVMAVVPLTISLAACNGGGNAGPAQTTQYGQLVAESVQVLGAYASLPQALYPTMLVSGGYIDPSTGTPSQAYESANIINTAREFNFSILPSQSYFKAATVAALALEYTTPGVNAATIPADITHTVSGLVIIPKGITPRGVVIYYHPTTLGKNQVPSCLGSLATGLPTVAANAPTYCNVTALDNTGAGMFAQLAATFAARGFVVIAPDYIGQGADYTSIHPYVAYPDNNAIAGLNMLAPLRQILATQFNLPSTSQLPLFLTGYSEGGGYALKAAELAQSSWGNPLADLNFQLFSTAPVEGAYSLEDQLNFAFDNNADGLFNCNNNPNYNCGNNAMMVVNQSKVTPEVAQMNSWNIVAASNVAQYKPNLTSYVLNAVGYYALHNLSSAYNQVMNNRFWSNIPMLNADFTPLGSVSSLPDFYSGIAGTSYTGAEIASSIFMNTTNINGFDTKESKEITFYTPFGDFPIPLPANFYGNNNSGLNFINGGVRTDPTFQNILISGSTYNWKTQTPINFIHLAYDSAVPVINANQAYSCMHNGVSYAGSATSHASTAPCNQGNASSLVESTVIQNFQYTNSYLQFTPMLDAHTLNPVAQSKFWIAAPSTLPVDGVPMDHGNIAALANIVALCTFENALNNGTNSGVCPTL